MQMLMSDALKDQTARSRRLVDARPVRVIAVASGKGGVGKTNVSVNLAVAIANRGREVMLLDADLAMANVDVLLGLQPRVNLSQVLDGRLSLEEIIIEGPSGIHIVPASSGVAELAALSPTEQAGLIRAFSELPHSLDVMVVDIAAGVSNSVVSFSRAAHDVVVVVCDEPASITDAYALIKVLSQEHELGRFQILANMVRSEAEGQALYRKISTVCERFLDVTLRYMGSVPHDEYLRKAVQKQRAVVACYPGSPSSRAFKKLAQQTENWPAPEGIRGHLEFFVERLVQPSRRGR